MFLRCIVCASCVSLTHEANFFVWNFLFSFLARCASYPWVAELGQPCVFLRIFLRSRVSALLASVCVVCVCVCVLCGVCMW